MALPDTIPNIDKYVGVVIAELAATLIFYIVLKIVHFCVWGHLYTGKTNDVEGKPLLIRS